MTPVHTSALSTVQYKLYSRAGVVLGVIGIHPHWHELLRKNGGLEFAMSPGLPSFSDFRLSDAVTLRYGRLSHSYEDRGGLYLDGISLEEFERIPGCSFAPSAAYLRSVLE